ncbi:hypothetical protein, partial [Paucibacter sp. B2R-40]|uniref:hypothetical protein n=1 Tax=Paucibacter sp. B2R-40 TaxID=2893554 RepID=UPI0021E4FCF4
MVLHAKFNSCLFIQSMRCQVILQEKTLPRTIVKFDAKQESAAPTFSYGRIAVSNASIRHNDC